MRSGEGSAGGDERRRCEGSGWGLKGKEWIKGVGVEADMRGSGSEQSEKDVTTERRAMIRRNERGV